MKDAHRTQLIPYMSLMPPIAPALWAYLIAQLVKNLPAMQETWVQYLGWEDPWRRERLLTPVFWPGAFLGLYSPWGGKELDGTE